MLSCATGRKIHVHGEEVSLKHFFSGPSEKKVPTLACATSLMVKLLSAILMKHNNGHPIALCSCFELSSFGFFNRSTIQEVCQFVSRETVARTGTGQANSVTHLNYNCHVRTLSTGLSVACVTDQEYPSFVVLGFLNKALTAFLEKHPEAEWTKITKDTNLTVPELDKLVQDYQDPSKVDKIVQIKQELERTTEIVIKTIDQLLEREEKLDDIVRMSQDLSFQSRALASSAKELNGCCNIL